MQHKSTSEAQKQTKQLTAVKVIRDEKQYHQALKRLQKLINADPKPGSAQEEEIELLAIVIESYERNIIPKRAATPLDAIKLRMEQRGLSRKDMAPFLGSASKVSEVLNGVRPLSLDMIRKLHEGLNIPAASLIAVAKTSEKNDADAIDYSRFPLSEMWNAGCFKNFKVTLQEVKASTKNWIDRFFEGENLTAVMHRRAPQAQSGGKQSDDLALQIWRVCALKKSREIELPKKLFDSNCMTQEWFRDLARLSQYDEGPRLAQQHLQKIGIAMVIQPHFKGTYLDGAAMLDGKRPVVALTLRYDRIDNFWFVLFHELAHVLKHFDGDYNYFMDNLETGTNGQKKEEEADEFARDALIPISDWSAIAQRLPLNQEEVVEAAQQLKIAPAILAGRIRKETKNYRLYSQLIGKKGQVTPMFCH